MKYKKGCKVGGHNLENIIIRDNYIILKEVNQMNKEFNKEFLELSEKDQKAIINLIQFKNMNKKDEYKKRIDRAIEYINERTIFNEYSAVYPSILDASEVKKILKILKGEDNV